VNELIGITLAVVGRIAGKRQIIHRLITGWLQID